MLMRLVESTLVSALVLSAAGVFCHHLTFYALVRLCRTYQVWPGVSAIPVVMHLLTLAEGAVAYSSWSCAQARQSAHAAAHQQGHGP